MRSCLVSGFSDRKELTSCMNFPIRKAFRLMPTFVSKVLRRVWIEGCLDMGIVFEDKMILVA